MVDKLTPGRVYLRVRRIPSPGRERPLRHLVHIVLSGGKELDMLPLATACAASGPASSTLHSAFENVRRRGETDGAAPTIATFLSSSYSPPSFLNYRTLADEKSSRRLLTPALDFVGAALGRREGDQPAHDLVVGVARNWVIRPAETSVLI